MELLKGKPVADEICEKILKDVKELKSVGIFPTLGILRVGNNESDIAYETSAENKAKSLGIKVKKYILTENATEYDIITILKIMNNDDNIHGILLFRPLPKNVNEEKVINSINPKKDIDGISYNSVSNLFTGHKDGFAPCTAEAAMAILKHCKLEIAGKKVVVIGRSLVIGKPIAMMLLNENATVTICHSKTKEEDLVSICKTADIIITATGKINTITNKHTNGNQVVIDVGINFDENGKLCGDVNFNLVNDKIKAITPVPGGVGSVTTSILMKHVVDIAKSVTQK